jgi:hypothetical protein
MRRIAIVAAILGVLIVADGIFQQVTSYNSGETQTVLQTSLTLTDGWTLIISGAGVLVVAVIAFVLSGRTNNQTQSAQVPAKPEFRVPAKN